MVARRHNLKIKWDDPQLREKALAFFLDVYRDAQKHQVEQLSRIQELTDEAERNNCPEWRIGIDNLPEEYLSNEHFVWLNNAYCGIDTLMRLPLPDVTDGRVAAFQLMSRRILGAAQRFIGGLLVFLMADKRFNPDARIRVDATDVLGFGDTKEDEREFYNTTFAICLSQKVYDILWRPRPADASFDEAIGILRKSGDIYFMTLASIFPICAIGKCHMAFDLFMDKIGTTAMEECVKNYVRRRKTMQRELRKWVRQNENGGRKARRPPPNDMPGNAAASQLSQEVLAAINRNTEAINKNTEATNKNTDRIVGMDNRLRDFLSSIKRLIEGFVKLFAPTKSRPTASQVAAQLAPPARYACLARIKEPHRTQIKAVIDYTMDHPVVLEQQNGDQFSLSNAARAVWNRDHAKWASIPGSFATFEALKAACYNLRKCDDDPFRYQCD